jgi:hypothetical protein
MSNGILANLKRVVSSRRAEWAIACPPRTSPSRRFWCSVDGWSICGKGGRFHEGDQVLRFIYVFSCRLCVSRELFLQICIKSRADEKLQATNAVSDDAVVRRAALGRARYLGVSFLECATIALERARRNLLTALLFHSSEENSFPQHF